jgi:hypothetical protein
MGEFTYTALTVGDLRRLIANLPDDALVGEPPDPDPQDREFIPFASGAVIHVKRAEPTKDIEWVRYFTSTPKLARIPALALKPR